MKKTILLLSVFFFALSLFAQEKAIKFYLNDGTNKIIKLDEIKTINLSNNTYESYLYIYNNNKLDSIYLPMLNQIKFEPDSLGYVQIVFYIESSKKYFNPSEIDSIIIKPYESEHFESILIGDQEWMLRNLDVDHFRNGDPIPNISNTNQWDYLITGAWRYYDNNDSLGAIYGKLYNWYAISDQRGLAPDGWHIPSIYEIEILSKYLGGDSIAGGKLKESGVIHWQSPNTGASNESRFTGLPGGVTYPIQGDLSINSFGGWWSISDDNQYTPDGSMIFGLSYNTPLLYLFAYDKHAGLSVRCIKNKKNINPTIMKLVPDSAVVGDFISIFGDGFGNKSVDDFVSFNGNEATEYKYWSESEIKVKVPVGAESGKLFVQMINKSSNEVNFQLLLAPKITNFIPQTIQRGKELTINGSDFGDEKENSQVFINTVPAIVYNSWSSKQIKVVIPLNASSGILYILKTGLKSNFIKIVITDEDPNEITIGSQIWMKKNLNVDRYRNGDLIPQVQDSSEWIALINLKKGAWCYNKYDKSNGSEFGKCYNWYAVNDPRGLAPEGWHVPTDSEWTILIDILGGLSRAGTKLKEEGISHWNGPNSGATNESGFTALPGGCGWPTNCPLRDYGFWWTSTDIQSVAAYYYGLMPNTAQVQYGYMHQYSGLYIRCLKD